MDRILIGTPASLSVTFYVDGAAVDPGTVTVTVTRADGTALVTGASTSGAGATPRTYALSAANAAALDALRLDWISPSQGTITTYAEIVGGFLFSIAEARAESPLGNVTNYPTADVVAARTLAECALEDACGAAFVPRHGREQIDGPVGGGTDVLLKKPNLRTITAASDTGITVVPSTLVLYETGVVYNPAKWSQGRRTVSISYTHGYQFAPARVAHAALLLAKRFLVDTPISDRATMLQNQDGTTEYLITAGVRQAVFDVPECNAIVQEYGQRFGIA